VFTKPPAPTQPLKKQLAKKSDPVSFSIPENPRLKRRGFFFYPYPAHRV